MTWDPVADEYVRRFADELDHKPLDRALLAVFAGHVRDRGRVLDVGCGPGHIAAHLRRVHTIPADGLDLSPEMVACAGRLTPDASFTVGDLCDLHDRDLAGIVGFYALCNLPPDALPRAAASLAAALAPGGHLLVSFHCAHAGPAFVHVDDMWGTPVSLDFWFHPVDVVAAALTAADLILDATLVRRPYPEEYASQRAYLLAHKPASTG